MPEEVQDDLINAVTACPNGVYRMMPEMPSTVETSNNLAVVVSDGKNRMQMLDTKLCGIT